MYTELSEVNRCLVTPKPLKWHIALGSIHTGATKVVHSAYSVKEYIFEDFWYFCLFKHIFLSVHD